MKLLSIQLHPFGQFIDHSWSLDQPLKVVAGPNEMGKTTLRQAIFHALFTSSRLTPGQLREKLKPWFPLPDGDHARVTLTFENAGQTWRLEKQWGQAATSRLSGDQRAPLADPGTVQQKLDEMLGNSAITWQKVLFTGHAELEQTLITLQKESGKLPDVRDLLRAAHEGAGDINEQQLWDKLEEQLKLCFGRWDEERNAPDAGRGIDNPWKNGVGQVLKAWYDWQTQKQSLTTALDAEQQLDELQRQLEEIERQTRESRELLDGYGSVESVVRKAKQDATEEQRLNELIERQEHDEQEWKQAEEQLAQSVQRDTLKQEMDQLEEEQKKSRLQQSAPEVCKEFEEICAARRIAEEAREKLQQHVVPDQSTIQRLKKTIDELTTCQSELRGRQLAWHAMLDQPGTITLTDGTKAPEVIQVTADGQSGTAKGQLVLRASGVTLTVQSGGSDVTDLLQQAADLTQKHADLLRACNSASLDEVEVMVRKHADLEKAQERADGALKVALAKRTFEDWEAQVKELQSLPEVRPLSVLEPLFREKVDQHRKIDRAIDRADAVVSKLVKSYESRPALLGLLVENRRQRDDLRQRQRNLPALPPQFDSPDAFLQAMEEARKIVQPTATRDEVKDKMRRAESILEGGRSQDLAEPTSIAEREFRRRLEFGRSLRRIKEHLQQLTDDNDRQETLQPFVDRVSDLFSRVTGRSVAVGFDETLPTQVTRDERVIGVERLSHGTIGALALAVRLALAEIYLQAGGGFVLLDDPLVHFDAGRVKEAAAVIREFSSRHQVLLLTCHDHIAQSLMVS
jgi:exonuclease SbcC